MSEIIGRVSEKNELQKALNSSKGELVAVVGRRRVGKPI
jgi:AAA+ ATPase superfamily predicted ATPase